jgi:hypothetical protein
MILHSLLIALLIMFMFSHTIPFVSVRIVAAFRRLWWQSCVIPSGGSAPWTFGRLYGFLSSSRSVRNVGFLGEALNVHELHLVNLKVFMPALSSIYVVLCRALPGISPRHDYENVLQTEEVELMPLEDALQVELDEQGKGHTLSAETTTGAADALAYDSVDVWGFVERDAANPDLTDGIFDL